MWGSTYIGIRLGVETIPPFLMAAIRFLIAGAILLAWEAVAVRRILNDPDIDPADRPRRPNRREWRDSAIVGGALLFGGMGMVALGEKTVPAGIAAILIALLPVWVAVLGRIFFGERLPRSGRSPGSSSASPASSSSSARSARRPASPSTGSGSCAC